MILTLDKYECSERLYPKINKVKVMNQLNCYNDIYKTKYSRMDQVKFVEDSI